MPAGQANSKCWKCHEAVWLAVTEKDKTMPMNTWSSPKGTYMAVDPETPKPMVHYIGKFDKPLAPGTPRYFPHFITCRKKGK